jgi:hypothetical protein
MLNEKTMLLTSQIIFTVISSITIIMSMGFGLNKTHMTNPLWPPHARFHWAGEFLNVMSVQCLALFLVWGHYPGRGSELATWAAGLAPVVFWGTFIPSTWFPGTSAWIDGYPRPQNLPAIFKRYNPNLFISVAMCLAAALGIWLDIKSR